MYRLKLLTAAAWCCLVASPANAQRIEWPWGGEWKPDLGEIARALSDPLSVALPTGLPTAQSLTRFVLDNPDKAVQVLSDPRYAAYAPVASAIQEGRNAALSSGTHTIPYEIRSALQGLVSAEFLDSVRWTTNSNTTIQNLLQKAQMLRDPSTRAITLMNVVIFRDRSGVDDVALWAHELHHVRQYSDWGVLEFAKRWVDNSSVTGPVEEPAYAFAASVMTSLQGQGIPSMKRVGTTPWCKEWNRSVATCDLYAANGGPNQTFRVSAEARATGHGGNSGRMSLLMYRNGMRCNSKGDESTVDTATELRGPDYDCTIELRPGESSRVIVTAPNSKADSVYTRARATVSPGDAASAAPAASRRSSFDCGSLNASTARCTLRASNQVQYTDFVVDGVARSKSDGTGTGRMRLEIRRGSNICNSGAGTYVGVQNATQLSGAGYRCNVRISGGESATVDLTAPNENADAEYTRASATFTDGPPR